MKVNKSISSVDPKRFQNVISAEAGDRGMIFIYGFIGEDYNYWFYDEEMKERSLTDIDFTRTLNELSAKYNRIDIRVNSMGGMVYHGNNFINAIRRSGKEIHIYNDGLAASMAGALWFSVPIERRHMAQASLLMVHPVLLWSYGNSVQLRRDAVLADKMTYTIATSIASNITLSIDEVMTRFMTDGEDHWFTSRDALQENFISSVEDYYIEAPDIITDNGTMPSYLELLEMSATNGDKNAKNFLSKYGIGKFKNSSIPTKEVIPIINNSKSKTMFVDTDKANNKIGEWLNTIGKKFGLNLSDKPTVDEVDEAINGLPDKEAMVKEITEKATNSVSKNSTTAIEEAISKAVNSAKTEFGKQLEDFKATNQKEVEGLNKKVEILESENKGLTEEITNMKAADTKIDEGSGDNVQPVKSQNLKALNGKVPIAGKSKY